jgi:hypothetical protein
VAPRKGEPAHAVAGEAAMDAFDLYAAVLAGYRDFVLS